MSRPAPRQSSLAGSSPVNPPSVQPPVPAPVDTRQDRGASTREPTKRKVGFYQAPEDTARVRGAILHTGAIEGPRTLSQFIDHAVMVEVERLEAKYNGGRPFPPVGARELPTGRPMGQ